MVIKIEKNTLQKSIRVDVNNCGEIFGDFFQKMLFFQRRRLKYRDILVLKCKELSLPPLSRVSEFCEPASPRTEKSTFLAEKKSKNVKMETHFRDENLNSRDLKLHSPSLDHSKPFSQGTVRLDFKNTKFFWEELK